MTDEKNSLNRLQGYPFDKRLVASQTPELTIYYKHFIKFGADYASHIQTSVERQAILQFMERFADTVVDEIKKETDRLIRIRNLE